MTQITKITPIAFRAATYQTPVAPEKPEAKEYDKNLSGKYLDNLAMINTPAVKKVDMNAGAAEPYKNNLRSMIQNNESVMLAIVPRTFTAEDVNGDDKITLCAGEKVGTFLRAIDRLDEYSSYSSHR